MIRSLALLLILCGGLPAQAWDCGVSSLWNSATFFQDDLDYATVRMLTHEVVLAAQIDSVALVRNDGAPHYRLQLRVLRVWKGEVEQGATVAARYSHLSEPRWVTDDYSRQSEWMIYAGWESDGEGAAPALYFNFCNPADPVSGWRSGLSRALHPLSVDVFGLFDDARARIDRIGVQNEQDFQEWAEASPITVPVDVQVVDPRRGQVPSLPAESALHLNVSLLRMAQPGTRPHRLDGGTGGRRPRPAPLAGVAWDLRVPGLGRRPSVGNRRLPRSGRGGTPWPG